MDFIYAAILGVVEGLTEFLPISSTGHLLVAIPLLGFPQFLAGADPERIKAYRDTFAIFIQLGAVVAVLLYYGRSLLRQAQQLPTDQSVRRFWLNILIAFLPAAVVGLLFQKQIDRYLLTPIVVGIALVVGGIIFLLVEQGPRQPIIHD